MFKTKIGVIITLALLAGSFSAVFAGVKALPQTAKAASSGIAQSNIATVPAMPTTGNTDPTATPVPVIQATDTPSQQPTTVPVPTTTKAVATATPSQQNGQTVDLHGTIGTVDSGNHSFQYHILGGSTITVVTNGSTQYNGVTSFSGIRAGQSAEVVGHYDSNGTLLATLVNAQTDN